MRCCHLSAAFLEIKFCVLYQHRGPERKNTPGRNSALATQHPILVYKAREAKNQLDIAKTCNSAPESRL
ncbi:hypothetical protein OUZ56_012888 [Daphnia magna]|uniref:Uncharacterized protein n=1 Tax=Daphnia magna TaxID=35525 RepID=A0ABQ9Z5G9_9CRUS|nr:hypothetical protein OUZ56_012888 [Daphnia magna]